MLKKELSPEDREIIGLYRCMEREQPNFNHPGQLYQVFEEEDHLMMRAIS